MMLGSMERHFVAIASIFLAAVVLIGSIACNPDSHVLPPSKDLEIGSWYDLDEIRNNLAGHHILLNDLNSTSPGYDELASPAANAGKGWEPIGIYHPDEETAETGFMGTFDGQGYGIRDLFIDRPDEDSVGLFKYVTAGIIQNVCVTNVTVIGRDGVGALAGSIYDCTISNSYCSGSVTGNDYVGGMGGGTRCTLTHSYFTGSVTGDEYVGGLAGMNHGTLSNSYSTSSVSGTSYVGGLVGSNAAGTVNHSYSTGNVTGNSFVGGLAGWNFANVSNSYSTGRVTGTNCVGGLVAMNLDTVDNSYSTGCVTGDESLGGLVGANYYAGDDRYGTVSSSFWDIETSGRSTSNGGLGKNTTEMQDIATFLGAAWNIAAVALNQTDAMYIWNIVSNVTYPFLSWQS